MRGLPTLGDLRPVLRVAVVMLGSLFAVSQLTGIVPLGGDSLAYWLADPLHPYIRSTVGNGYAYLYSPAFAQAIEPLRLVPWPVFAAIWTMILAVALAWTTGPWGHLLVLFPPVLASIALGNIEILMATAIVAGFRYQAAWAFVLLTKVTPGVGLSGSPFGGSGARWRSRWGRRRRSRPSRSRSHRLRGSSGQTACAGMPG